jgi:hypothetical protein
LFCFGAALLRGFGWRLIAAKADPLLAQNLASRFGGETISEVLAEAPGKF